MITELLSRELAEQARAASLEAALAREAPAPADGDLRGLAELLEQYLGAVPGALDALVTMSKHSRYGRSVAFVAGQVLLYLVDEDDLFSDAEFGPLGLLDDAYLVHGCVAALRLALPELAAPAGYAPPDPRAVTAVRALLPAGVPEALDRTCESMVSVAAALYAGGGGDASAADRPRPSLRVEDALDTLGTGSRARV